MITAIIIAGAALMIWNIYRFILFIRSTHDVLSANSARDTRWMRLALVLLIFFFGGYLFVGIFAERNLPAYSSRSPKNSWSAACRKKSDTDKTASHEAVFYILKSISAGPSSVSTLQEQENCVPSIKNTTSSTSSTPSVCRI